jgi:hypothetical protein
LEKANLKIKLEKCAFASRKIDYLSHIIANGTITPNSKQTDHVYKMKIPKIIKHLKGFLGYASYYRKFIKNFSKIEIPLIRATINLTVKCQD